MHPFERGHLGVPAKDPLTEIPASRHPFQFWVMFAMSLSGASNFFVSGSEILNENLSFYSHKIWALTLLVGGITALLAAWWPDRITGLLMERLALISIGVSCPIYAIVVATLAVESPTSVLGVSLTASVGIASLWRARHVKRELRLLKRFVARSYE